MQYRLLLTLWDANGQNIKLFVDIPEDYANMIRAFKLKATTLEVQEHLPLISIGTLPKLEDIRRG